MASNDVCETRLVMAAALTVRWETSNSFGTAAHHVHVLAILPWADRCDWASGYRLARWRGERAGIRWWPGALGGLFCDKFLAHLKQVRVQFQLEPARRRLHVGGHVRPAPARGRSRPRCGELHRIGADPFVRLPQQAARGQPQGTAQPLARAVIAKRAQPDRHRPRARPGRPTWAGRLIGHLAGWDPVARLALLLLLAENAHGTSSHEYR